MGFVSEVATSPLRFDRCQVAILEIMRKRAKKVKLLLPSIRLFLIALSALFRKERPLVTWLLISFVGFYPSSVHGNAISIRLEKTLLQTVTVAKECYFRRVLEDTNDGGRCWLLLFRERHKH